MSPSTADPAFEAWAGEAEKVRKFVEMNGKIPGRRSSDPHAVRLGQWIESQRRSHRRGTLGDERVKLLERTHPGILNTLAVAKPSFDNRLAELERFMHVHGRLPRRVVPSEEELAVWTAYHRSKRDSDKGRARILSAIDAHEALVVSSWEDSFAQTKEFLKQHGELPKRPTEYRLSNWLSHNRQSHKVGALSADRVELLRVGLGIDLAQDWQSAPYAAKLGRIAEFFTKQGRLPRFSDPDHQSEARWINWQRVLSKKGHLEQDRSALIMEHLPEVLIGDGYSQELREERWQADFRAVEEFLHRCGRLPNRYSRDESRLGEWVSNQLKAFKAGRLHPERAATIQAKLPALLAGINPRA